MRNHGGRRAARRLAFWALIGLLPTPHALPQSGPSRSRKASPRTVVVDRYLSLAPADAGDHTVGGLYRSLAAEPADSLSTDGRALRCVLAATLAIGAADGPAAADLLDAPGYQPLPLSGELPDDPARPVLRTEFGRWVAAASKHDLARLPADAFTVATRTQASERFPAVAAWMLESDRAVLLRPVQGVRGWVTRECCVVVRVRAQRAVIVGGNLFDALDAKPERG